MARIESPKILRFHRSERSLHWAIAIPFLVCFATAAVLILFYNPHPDRPYRAVVSWTHRISGIALFALPLVTLLRNRAEARRYLANIKEALTFRLDDARWLILSGPAALGRVRHLPEQGKFNAAEKLNFMMVMGSWPLFTVTGVLIWLPGIAFVSWLLHVGMAALAAPLVIGHIFMATINPGTRVGLSGMISGYVDREWARHHYARWYREVFGVDRPARAPAPRPSPVVAERRPPPPPEPLPRPAFAAAPAVAMAARPVRKPEPVPSVARSSKAATYVHCPSCRTEHAVASWDRLVQRVFAAEPLPCPGCGRPLDAFAMVAASGDLEEILDRLDRGGAAPAVSPPPRREPEVARTQPVPVAPRGRPTSIPVSPLPLTPALASMASIPHERRARPREHAAPRPAASWAT